MAVYPEGNPGAWPLDPATTVGQFRVLYGDITSEPYVPAQPGFQNYEELSDTEIEGFLAQGGDAPGRAIGYLYLAMAGQAAKESRSIKDYDLQVDLTKRAADLRAIAQMWFDRGDSDDLIAGEDAFEIVPTGTSRGGFIPEASPVIYGRQYATAPLPFRPAPTGDPDLDGGFF